MKKFIFALIFVLHVSFCFALDFSLSLTPFVAHSEGGLNEILYHSRDNSKKISLLEWDRNVWLYGAAAECSLSRFHAEFQADSAVQINCGEMKDSDWLNTLDYSMKTTYSVGDIDSTGNYDLSLSLSFDALKTEGFFIAPVFSAQYSYDSFSRGRDARGWYGHSEYSSDGKNHNWYDEEAAQFPSEYYWSEEKQKYVRKRLGGIDYYRHSFFSWAGIKVGFSAYRFSFVFDALVSPFVYFSSEDVHHGSSSDSIYHAIQTGNFAYSKISSKIAFSINKRFDIVSKISFLFGKTLVGDLYSDWYLITDQPSGADIFESTLYLGCRIKIKN